MITEKDIEEAKAKLWAKFQYLNDYGSMEVVTQDWLEGEVGGSLLDEVLFEVDHAPEEDLEWRASSIVTSEKYGDCPVRIEMTHLPSGRKWWFPSEIYAITDPDLQEFIYGISTIEWKEF